MTGQKVTCKAQVYGSVYKLRIKGQRVEVAQMGVLKKTIQIRRLYILYNAQVPWLGVKVIIFQSL